MFFAIRLGGDSLLQEPRLMKLEETILHDLGLLWCGRPSEVVKADLEPVIDSLVLGMELVAEGLRGDSSFECASLGGRAVLVCSADVEGRAVAQLAVAAEDIGTERATDNVAKMGDIVYVRESGGNEDVVLPPRLGEDDWSR